MVHSFEKASGRSVAFRIAPRRPGDIAQCYSAPELALDRLGWSATRDLDAMCADAWRWQERNPMGYKE
jgi:UDP-glucose 4-epimerase